MRAYFVVSQWTPYRATGAVLMVALALNLWTRNTLWLIYTLVGCAVFAAVVASVRRSGWYAPPRAVWMVGIAAGLHYVGGSMAGLHLVGGPNGLYYAFPWWDNVVHVLGSFAIASAAAAGLLPLLPARRGLVVVLAASLAALVGTLVEVYEFVQYVYFGTVDQGYYTNTLVDLWNNVLGAFLGAALFVHGARGEPEPSTSPA